MTKHIFIVNPAAGKGSEAVRISEAIRDACDICQIEYEIHMTNSIGDAERFARERAMSKSAEDEYRFYACGGDGTLSEVVSGIVGLNDELREKICVGCMPIGTGNDFTKNFKQSEFFLDITKQLLADPMTIDCFKVEGSTPESIRYGVNMVNVGFDCQVVCKAAELKKRHFLPKSLAYLLGVIIILKKNPGQIITVTNQNGIEITAEFQLAAVANGGFCGGGFNSAPESKLDDGLLDLSLIKKVTRTTFLRLVGRYKAGTHLKSRLGRKVVNYRQVKLVEFKFPTETKVCIDGEIIKVDRLKLTVVPHAIKFLLPVGTVKKK